MKHYDDLLGFSSGSPSGGKPTGFAKCYSTHPGLKIGEFEVFGGSCSSPVVLDADIYIGFDYSMSFSKGHWPWAKTSEEVYFQIKDMHAPSNAAEFKQLVGWAAGQIQAGKKLHAGCIGGHGRTGTFLAALVTFMTGELDSITYVRKHYCKKAVETHDQIEFLNKHFGITKVEGSKAYATTSWPKTTISPSTHSKPKSTSALGTGFSGKPSGVKTIDPVASKMTIWAVKP